MLDIGWTELLVVAVVLIVVIGPRELPHMLRTFGKAMSQLRRMATDFRSQMDDALKEADMEDVTTALRDVRKLNPASQLRDAVNPLRQTARDLQSDLKRSTSLENSPKPKAGKSDIPNASYPIPGVVPDFSGSDVFEKALKRDGSDEEPALVSVRQGTRLVSRQKSFKPAPRPVKSSAHGSRRRKSSGNQRND